MAEECVKALLKDSINSELAIAELCKEALNKAPQEAAQETLQKVVAVQKHFWRSLTGDGLNLSQADWEAMHSRFASLSVDSEKNGEINVDTID